MDSTLDYVKRKLEASKGTWGSVCTDTGLGYSWLTKLAQGKIPNPGIKKIEKLFHYYRAKETV